MIGRNNLFQSLIRAVFRLIETDSKARRESGKRTYMLYSSHHRARRGLDSSHLISIVLPQPPFLRDRGIGIPFQRCSSTSYSIREASVCATRSSWRGNFSITSTLSVSSSLLLKISAASTPCFDDRPGAGRTCVSTAGPPLGAAPLTLRQTACVYVRMHDEHKLVADASHAAAAPWTRPIIEQDTCLAPPRGLIQNRAQGGSSSALEGAWESLANPVSSGRPRG